MSEPPAIAELRDRFPTWSRVRRGANRGTVADVGVVRCCAVVYVSWDTSRLEAVVAYELRKLEQ